LEGSASAQEAGELLSRDEVRAVFVCAAGRLIGVVTRKTLVREIVAGGRDPRATELGSIAEEPMLPVDGETDLGEAFRLVEELYSCGADTFVRVGTAGGMQQDVLVGDLVIAEAAVRDEGTSAQYVPLAFPAVADPDLTAAFREGARALGLRHHVGVVHSKD